MAEELLLENPELQMLLNIKESGFNYRMRRHGPWRENYELYRDHVTINRLTQRQSVNLPIMKKTLRTLLKDIDDLPVIEFKNLDNDDQAQIFQNEYWKHTLECNNAEIQDIVDKKQDFFFGRTFDMWQVEDGKVVFNIVDTEDIYVNRFMNPYDLNSSRDLTHLHIFVPLSKIKSNPDYDKAEVAKLDAFFKTKLGLMKANDNQNSLQEKNKKLAELGVPDTDSPVLGETYVELTRYHAFRDEEVWEGNKLKDQIWVYIEAEGRCMLMKKPQEVIMGVTKDHWWQNHYPYHTWGDDIDKQDFWTDGIADIVRPSNKVVNAWYSQLVENRTMRNMGMNFYDASLQADGFMPNTFEPRAFGFYPIPVPADKKLGDVFERVDIPDLSESLDEIDYVVQMNEAATGATATQQGAPLDQQKTLGEVQLAQGEAKARIHGVSKFYTHVWKQRGQTFLKLIESAHDKIDAVKIWKKGKNSDKVYPREIAPKDWMTESGYTVKVWSQDEKEAQDTKVLEKLNAVKMVMPDNPKLAEIHKRKLLEFVKLTPEEVSEVMEFEQKKMMMLANGTMGLPPQPGMPGQPGAPMDPGMAQGGVPPMPQF